MVHLLMNNMNYRYSSNLILINIYIKCFNKLPPIPLRNTPKPMYNSTHTDYQAQ